MKNNWITFFFLKLLRLSVPTIVINALHEKLRFLAASLLEEHDFWTSDFLRWLLQDFFWMAATNFGRRKFTARKSYLKSPPPPHPTLYA
jgi:hypothetical protein